MVPAAGTADYADAVERELAATPYVSVVAASDSALVALRLPGAELVDKSALPARAAAAGLAVPRTLVFDTAEDLLAASERLDYPVVLKPTVKSGATSVARCVTTPDELTALALFMDWPCLVQPYLSGALRAVSGVIHDGRLLACVHQDYLRTWPADCGVSSAAVTVSPDTDLESRLPALLEGHAGVFQVQLVGDLVIDVNPRVYGSLPLAVAAGANLPAIACAAEQGRVADLVRGRPGVRYRWLEGDLRRLLWGVRSAELTPLAALAALAPRRGTAHSVESLRDPGPLLTRIADVVRRRLP